MTNRSSAIHIVTDTFAGKIDIPLLLSVKHLSILSIDKNLGSQSYSASLVALATGGGVTRFEIGRIRGAYEDDPQVPWLRADLSKRKLKMTPPATGEEAYGKTAAERLKKRLDELQVGKEGVVKKGMFWF
ncbi:hypothetical protein P154DRAFT_339722 [Amniculicola lignicola CBS 123094]|uniref:Uncharacterized protein n=1 Tax=Amniculicola lignicola CBS 123094 TaxID=1392246 RepID=A0A6A5WX28_9PLEO|nr:hypothetical protein P154DRAFT_339722 [Amniculicola lignicola CBS 123094]